jgi:hypothetical protein
MPARALAAAGLALQLLALPASAAEDRIASALDGLSLTLASPSCTHRVCPSGARHVAAALAAARKGQLTRALSTSAGAVAALERAHLVTGDLAAWVQELAGASDEAAAVEADFLDELLLDLCSSVRTAARKAKVRPDASLTRAREQVNAQLWSAALRSYSSALGSYASTIQSAQNGLARCRPRPCRTDDFVSFVPGLPQNPALGLVPPDRGTRLCYSDAVLGETEGTVCVGFTGLTTLTIDGEISSPDLGGTARLSGRASVTSCTDSRGWVRIERSTQSLTLRANGRTARLPISFSCRPPTVSFLSVLLPSPPSALEMRVGDRMSEPALQCVLRVLNIPARADCTAFHEVAAIEDVTVPAGTFEAVRIDSDIVCETEVDGFTETTSQQTSTWLASELGQVKVEVREDGNTLVDLELTSFQLP